MRRSSPVFLTLVSVLSALLAQPVLAAAPLGWHRNVTVKYVYAGQQGGRAAVAINETVNYGTCPSQEFTLDINSEYFPYLFAMLMNAYTKGTPVNIYTNGVCTVEGMRATDVAAGDLP